MSGEVVVNDIFICIRPTLYLVFRRYRYRTLVSYYLSRNIPVSLLTMRRRSGERSIKKLLFLFTTDDQKMRSGVHHAAVLAGRLPLKVDQT